jgi:hypothetical protein
MVKSSLQVDLRTIGQRKCTLLIIIPLALSSFTHLWNPIGFPGIHYDEAIYLERSMRVLQDLGPQDPRSRYDHPFFGQLFLAGIFKMIGYPDSLHPVPGDINSIEMLYLVPRLLMGVLAVADTFLIYKIAERRYNRNVALIASILFAVMPLSWLIRRIFLESIQLPFILSSILFALYSYNTKNKYYDSRSKKINQRHYNKKKILTVTLSGLFLGIAILTKIPAFAIIPAVAFLIYTNNNKSLKTLGLWFIPIILIPAIWPVYAFAVGELDKWLDLERGVLWQTQRTFKPLTDAAKLDFEIDPVLFLLGMLGIIYTVIVRRDMLTLLWTIPFLLFLYQIHFVSYWHLVPILPVLCIAASIFIEDISRKLKPREQTSLDFYQKRTDDIRKDNRRNDDRRDDDRRKIQQKMIREYGESYLLYRDIKKIVELLRLLGLYRDIKKIVELLRHLRLPSAKRWLKKFVRILRIEVRFILVIPVCVIGLVSFAALLETSVNSNYFDTVAYVVQYLAETNNKGDDGNGVFEDIGVIGSPRFFWIPKHVFHEDYGYKSYASITPVTTEKNIAIVDRGFRKSMIGNEVMRDIYEGTSPRATYSMGNANYDTSQYPYVIMKHTFSDPKIEIRSNFD